MTARDERPGTDAVFGSLNAGEMQVALAASDMPAGKLSRGEEGTASAWRWLQQGIGRLGGIGAVKGHAVACAEVTRRASIIGQKALLPGERAWYRRAWGSSRRHAAAVNAASRLRHDYENGGGTARPAPDVPAWKMTPGQRAEVSARLDALPAGVREQALEVAALRDPGERFPVQSGLTPGQEALAAGAAARPVTERAPVLDPMKIALYKKIAEWDAKGGPVAWIPPEQRRPDGSGPDANARLRTGPPRDREEIRAEVDELRQNADDLTGRIDDLIGGPRNQNAGRPAGPAGSGPGTVPVPVPPLPGSAPGVGSANGPGSGSRAAGAAGSGGAVPSGSGTGLPGGGELPGDTPYAAAHGALETFRAEAGRCLEAAGVLEAQLTVYGFDRDPQLLAAVNTIGESCAAAYECSVSTLRLLDVNHATGAEYHARATAAGSSGFRPVA